MSINSPAIKKFQSLEEIHVPFCTGTNMPFVTCDDETYNDQIWTFTSLDAVKEFAQTYAQQKLAFRDVLVKKAQFGAFFMDLYSMGINEIVFCDEQGTHKLDFSQIVKFPDFSKMPEKQRPLMNQELQLSTIYFLQEARKSGVEPDKAKLEPLAEEMYANLANSRFLHQVMTDDTQEHTKGKLLFPLLTDKKGNQFQPIFSDHNQYMKHRQKNKPAENTRTLLVGIEELKKYLMKQAKGYLINPDGYCHVLTMQQLEYLIKHFQ